MRWLFSWFNTVADGGMSFAAVLFYGHELTLLIFEVLIFGLVDLASHNYFLAAAVVFFVMEASCFCLLTVQFVMLCLVLFCPLLLSDF